MPYTQVILVLLVLWVSGCVGMPLLPEPFESSGPHSPSVVIGSNSAAVEAATAWLEARRSPVVEQAALRQWLRERTRDASGNESQLMAAAKALQATTLVYVQTLVKPLNVRRPLSDDGAVRQAEPQTLYIVQVAVQGIEVGTGALVWEGMAKSVYPVPEADQAIVELTKQALTTALRHAPAAWQRVLRQGMVLSVKRS